MTTPPRSPGQAGVAGEPVARAHPRREDDQSSAGSMPGVRVGAAAPVRRICGPRAHVDVTPSPLTISRIGLRRPRPLERHQPLVNSTTCGDIPSSRSAFAASRPSRPPPTTSPARRGGRGGGRVAPGWRRGRRGCGRRNTPADRDRAPAARTGTSRWPAPGRRSRWTARSWLTVRAARSMDVTASSRRSVYSPALLQQPATTSRSAASAPSKYDDSADPVVGAAKAPPTAR